MRIFAIPFRGKHIGEMAEWSNAAVLKTVDLNGSGGSNPSLSANKGVNQVVTRFTPFFTPKNQGRVKIFEIFKINADEKRRSYVFLFLSASLLCYRSENKFSSLCGYNKRHKLNQMFSVGILGLQ